MPAGEMRYDIARAAKKLREDCGYTLFHVAKQLGMSEKEYLDFEECRSSPEDDYYIISGLAIMYGVSWENFFRIVRGESIIEDIIGEFIGFTPELQAEFISIIEHLGYIDEKEFKKLEKEKGGFKFAYIDYEGVRRYAALCESDEMAGAYLVILGEQVYISRLGIYDNEKCFKIEDRMYPLSANAVKVFGKIYSGIKSGE